MQNRPLAKRGEKNTKTAVPIPAAVKDTLPGYAGWLIFAFAFLLYANTLDLKFALDDSLMITENKYTVSGIKGIPDILSHDAFEGFLGKNNLLPGGRYRPLSQIMFATEYEFFGANPIPGHLINVLLYSLCCLLLFKMLLVLMPAARGRDWYLSVAFVAAVLFAAHPLHTEVVANIKGRDEILCLLFSLLALLFSVKYAGGGKLICLPVILLCVFLAMLSKENAATLLAIVPLVLYFFVRPGTQRTLIPVLTVLGGIAAAVILRIAMIQTRTEGVQDSSLLNNPFVGVAAAEKAATLFYTWLRYLGLMIFPHPLTHDYYPKQIAITNFSNPLVIFSGLLLIFLTVIAAIKTRSRSIPAFAFWFFVFSFSIVSNAVFNIGTFMNERFLFTPLLGFSLFLAWCGTDWLYDRLRNHRQWKQAAIALFGVVVLLYSIRTISRNRVWMDDFTLFTTDVRVSANSAKCNTSAGGKLIEKADSTESQTLRSQYYLQARKYLAKAVEIYPANINAWLLLGNANLRLGDFTNSYQSYAYCLRLNPRHPHAANNMLALAQRANNSGQFAVSLKAYRVVNRLNPGNPETLFGIGNAYRGLQQYDSALIFLKSAVEIKPAYADAWAKMGEIYGQNLNDITGSEACLRRALELDPANLSANENMGIVCGIMGDFSHSLDYFGRALAIKPSKAEIYFNISETYRHMGQQKPAAIFKAKYDSVKALAIP